MQTNRIGREFQAVIPDLVDSSATEEEEMGLPERGVDEVAFDCNKMPERAVEAYIQRLATRLDMRRSELSAEFIEVCLAELHKANYNAEVATNQLENSKSFPPRPPFWSPRDMAAFEEGIKRFGHELDLIRSMVMFVQLCILTKQTTQFVPSKSMKEIVEFFYRWKKSDRYLPVYAVYCSKFRPGKSIKQLGTGKYIDAQEYVAANTKPTANNANRWTNEPHYCQSCDAEFVMTQPFTAEESQDTIYCDACLSFWKRYGGSQDEVDLLNAPDKDSRKKRGSQAKSANANDNSKKKKTKTSQPASTLGPICAVCFKSAKEPSLATCVGCQIEVHPGMMDEDQDQASVQMSGIDDALLYEGEDGDGLEPEVDEGVESSVDGDSDYDGYKGPRRKRRSIENDIIINLDPSPQGRSPLIKRKSQNELLRQFEVDKGISLIRLEERLDGIVVDEMELVAMPEERVKRLIDNLEAVQNDLKSYNAGELAFNDPDSSRQRKAQELMTRVTREISLVEQFLAINAQSLTLDKILQSGDSFYQESVSEVQEEDYLSSSPKNPPEGLLLDVPKSQNKRISLPLSETTRRWSVSSMDSLPSRQSTMLSRAASLFLSADSQIIPPAPQDMFRWSPLRMISEQVFGSDLSPSRFGAPTVFTVSSTIAIGTSRSMILLFDLSQTLKVVLGDPAKAGEIGSVTALAAAVERNRAIGGYASGTICVWDIQKRTTIKIIAPTPRVLTLTSRDGHFVGSRIIHVSFIGRRSDFVSADSSGSAFYHTDTRSSAIASTIEVEEVWKWEGTESIVAVHWLNDQIIAFLTNMEVLTTFDTTTMKVLETSDMKSRGIICHNYFGQSPPPDSAPHEMAFYHSVRSYKGRIFLMFDSANFRKQGNQTFEVGSPLPWKDRIAALARTAQFEEAVELGLEFHSGIVSKTATGLPTDANVRQDSVAAYLAELLMTYVEMSLPSEENGLPSSSESEGMAINSLARTCFKICVAIKREDLLFGEIFDMFEDSGNVERFLNCLEAYLLQDRVTEVYNPSVVQALVTFLSQQSPITRLEQAILRLDPALLDLNNVIGLCRQHGLYSALIYVFTMAAKDFVSPITELLAIIVTSLQHDRMED
ncbi:Vacuolar protein sorting-associated protein 8, partial [Blyttiomyces sp. JEL0837]